MIVRRVPSTTPISGGPRRDGIDLWPRWILAFQPSQGVTLRRADRHGHDNSPHREQDVRESSRPILLGGSLRGRWLLLLLFGRIPSSDAGLGTSCRIEQVARQGRPAQRHPGIHPSVSSPVDHRLGSGHRFTHLGMRFTTNHRHPSINLLDLARWRNHLGLLAVTPRSATRFLQRARRDPERHSPNSTRLTV